MKTKHTHSHRNGSAQRPGKEENKNNTYTKNSKFEGEWKPKKKQPNLLQQTSNANLFQNHIFCFIGIFALVSISWMSTRSVSIYVVRFSDRLFTLSFVSFTCSFVFRLLFCRAYFHPMECVLRSFFCPAFAWNWHKTWTVLYICLLLFFPEMKKK